MNEYLIKSNIYVELKNDVVLDDTEDLGYRICDYIKDHITFNNSEYYIHESIINEDVDNELKIFCSFYIESEKEDYNEVINEFITSLPHRLSNIDSVIKPSEDINIQIY